MPLCLIGVIFIYKGASFLFEFYANKKATEVALKAFQSYLVNMIF